MFFGGKSKPRITLSQQLAAKPVRLVEARQQRDEKGGASLKVTLKSNGRWNSWLFRVPEGATKTFELDALGLLVWEHCDGKTSVQQIIRKLAKQYNLNLREAQVPTLSFLRTLVKKGLIGMTMPDHNEAQ